MTILESLIDDDVLTLGGMHQDPILQSETITIVIDNFQGQHRPLGGDGMIMINETVTAVIIVTKDEGPIHTRRNLDHRRLSEDKIHIVLVEESQRQTGSGTRIAMMTVEGTTMIQITATRKGEMNTAVARNKEIPNHLWSTTRRKGNGSWQKCSKTLQL
jgi:hypothetical protein